MTSVRTCIAVLAAALVLPACLGQRLLGTVEGTQTKLQRAIRDGSKALNCAPKDTAIAEANIKFAQDALTMGEYYRGKEHAELAAFHAERARRLTDPKRCRDQGAGRIGDRDGDGLDDGVDKCPGDAEDFDSFEDADGCPDSDNDGDGVLDAASFVDGRWVNADRKGDRDCRNEPEDIDGFEDEDGCPDPDNDGDNILDASDQCPIEAEDIDNFEDEDGCPDADNDLDELCDPWVESSGQGSVYRERCSGVDKCPDQPEDYDGEADEDGCPDRKAAFDGCSVSIQEKVFFKSDKWDIDPRSFALLDDVADVIKEVPDELRFSVEGHTDSKGSDAYNKRLSQRRAESVTKYLVGKGIPAARLQSIGYGEERPIDSNRTADGRARNRRVEFNVSNAECERR